LGDVSAIISARAAANISDIGVAGEVLRADFAALNILGGTVDIEHGGMEQASGDLHSMALLIALQRSDPLRLASISLPYIIENFFNGDLFASDPSEAAPDFLSNLIRYEFGTQDASGEGEAGTKLSLLSKFGNDASTLSQFFGAGEEITRPVYEIMMSYYHERLAPVVPPALVPEEFFPRSVEGFSSILR
jgi:hypothetical protein